MHVIFLICKGSFINIYSSTSSFSIYSLHPVYIIVYSSNFTKFVIGNTNVIDRSDLFPEYVGLNAIVNKKQQFLKIFLL